MDVPNDTARLTQLFESLGARNAGGWADSQISEGIPQLQRYLFLRQAWRAVLDERDVDWIAREIRYSERDAAAPYAGVAAQDLMDIVRGVQAKLLFGLCHLLDDPGLSEPALESLAWGLFEVDEQGNPVLPRLGGLHESVLETDPTGREMRPSGIDTAKRQD